MMFMLVSWPIGIGVALLLLFVGVFVAARKLIGPRWLRWPVLTFSSVVITLALLVTSWGLWIVSGDTSAEVVELADGLTYERLKVGEGVGHVAAIDLEQGCLDFVTTDVADDGSVSALSTEAWAEEQSVLLAMNASFFFPFVDKPWESYPHPGEEVTILGKSVVDGEIKGMPRDWQGNWEGETVYVDESGQLGMSFDFADDAVWGVTGRERLVADSQIVASEAEPYARSVIGINTDTNMMWWLVVDGKQPGYSRGATLREAAELLIELGATDALELDGGGSAILVDGTGSEVNVLSRPFNRRMPGRTRVVANHVGLVASDDCADGLPSGDG